MAIKDVILPKKYKNGKVLFEENLDAWRTATEAAFAAIKKNLVQISKDSFTAGYDYKNNGVAQKPLSLEDRLDDLVSGGAPFPGTISNTFTINTDGFSATLDTVNLTANRTFTFPDVSGTFALLEAISPQLVPIGSIIPFYDFNGGLTFDATYWAYCNGQVKNVGALVAQTLPDLSGRYIVGFGTDGGADNGSAAWSAAAVGNAAHQIAIDHTHTGAAHTHDLQNHTHSTPNHQHSLNVNNTQVGVVGATVIGSENTNNVLQTMGGAGATNFRIREDRTEISGSGTSGAPSTNTSGSTAPGVGSSSLSATQSIQPRSIRVRYLMRIL